MNITQSTRLYEIPHLRRMKPHQLETFFSIMEAFEKAETVLDTNPGDLILWMLESDADGFRDGSGLRELATDLLSFDEPGDSLHKCMKRIHDYTSSREEVTA